MRTTDHVTAYGTVDGDAAGRRGAASTGSPSGSARRRSSPTTARCSPSGSRCCAPRCPRGLDAQLRGQGEPDAGRRPAPRGPGRLARRRVGAARCGSRSTPGCRRDRDQLRRARARPPPSCAGRRRRRDDRDGVDAPRLQRVVAHRRASSALRPRVAVRVNPTSRSRARACGWAAARSSSASTPSRCRRCSAELRRRDVDVARLPRLRRLAEPQRRDPRARRSERPSSSSSSSPSTCPAPCRYVNLGGGFGIPYFEKDEPLDLDGDRPTTSPTLVDGRDRARRCPDARVVIELGRYIVGEAGVYVTRVVDRKESRGTDLPRRRRRHAPPARRLRQLRPGDPAQLPGRGRHRGPSTSPTEHRHASSAACARRSTCSATRSSCPRADVGDLVVVFQAGAYGLTASPTAFLGHPAPVGGPRLTTA